MMPQTSAQPWTDTPRPPKLKLPPGACDGHVHIFGPGARFPYGGSYTPSDAPNETLTTASWSTS